MLRQSLNLKLLQKLSPQQIQLMKLIQLPALALEARIKEELEENPALDDTLEEEWEADDDVNQQEEEDSIENFEFGDYMEDEDNAPDYQMYTNNSSENEERDIPFAQSRSFQDILKTQLDVHILSDQEYKIALNIIGNLDDSGYLRRELHALVDDLAFSQNVETTEDEILSVLHIIQAFDPPGIGARSLQECLVLQLDRKIPKSEPVKIARLVMQKQFEEFTKKHYDKIIHKLGLTEDQLKKAIEEILKLNPKPGNALTESVKQVEQIIPDFVVHVIDGKLDMTLNGRNIPELRLSRKYSEMFEGFLAKKDKVNSEDKKAILFVKQKMDSARWFIDALKQRQQTLQLTMNAILIQQKEYFLTGDDTKLKPMILKDVSEKVGLDISTISRVVNSKYVQTPYGTFLLKTFFSESILSSDDGEEVSSREIKQLVLDMIETEDKKNPITDDQLTEKLQIMGYSLARRTIAKYREQMHIPVARLRKEL
jgi:RNA polymerase sigma-54 factor